ncbi:MAG TPA: sigma 54-interacting transcriptional regulator [Patescibacteria group bacterium]|nr:sigma 54-interacting transcriptional regulator [Patescibacteria group bacterium]
MRIVFISPYRDLSRLGQTIAKELNIDLETYEGSMEQAVTIISNLKGPKVDAFISRRGTAAFISAHTEAPVVMLDTGPMDILASCLEARHVSRNIVVTSYEPVGSLELLEAALDVSLTNITVSSLQDLKKKISDMGFDGDYCVVGGWPSVSFAREAGREGIILRTSPESVREALIRARDIAKLRREEKAKAFRLKAIMESVYDGILAVDENGRVEVFNRSAEKILGFSAETVVGKDANVVIRGSRMDQVLRTMQPEIGEIQVIGDVKVLTNRIPVLDGDAVIGAVATFQDMDGVVLAERAVRKELTGGQFRAKFLLDDIVSVSPVMQERKSLAESFASSELTVLIYGPSGTGKELFAQGIHNASRRASQPFVAVNCGALPPALLESELFGYEEGAFTGARRKGKHGLFELAHGGTIFLDEVDSLPLELQGRLLRVLQEREVLRVGGESIIAVDIRVISATNTPPRQLLKENRLRADLFYRLNVLYMELPPLAERLEDIPVLCRAFLPEGFLDAAEWFQDILPLLERYSWPGNVRELYNFAQRMLFYRRQYRREDVRTLLQVIAPSILEELHAPLSRPGNLRGELAFEEMERITNTIKTAGSVKKAAQCLGISESTLWRKIRKHREVQQDVLLPK